MGRERTLLERIAATGEGERLEPSPREDFEALADSVRRNLERMLSSRHGLSQALPDYGLPALTDLVLGSRDYVQRVQEAIRTAVDKYEPRLRQVRVTHRAEEGDKQTLSFLIEGMLVGRTAQHRVCFSTAPSREGRFEVSE